MACYGLHARAAVWATIVAVSLTLWQIADLLIRVAILCLQGTRAALWMSLVSILAKLGTLQMEQLRNQALVILQRSVSLSCKL